MVVNAEKCNEIWRVVLSKLEHEIKDTQVYKRLFLENTSLHSIEGDKAIISVKSRTSKVVIELRYLNDIEKILQQVSESNFSCVIKEESDLLSIPSQTEIKSVSELEVYNSNLNPSLTFNNFIVGSSNREAHDAGIAIAVNPGRLFNPLFIYGKSGIGKTHLLNAIGNHSRSNLDRSFKVLYISTNDFINDYVNAVRSHNFDYLISKFESVDMLLVDDIQFLAAKESTSEYFFTIFNKLINLGKQIVLTSDRHPNALKGLEDRLVSRFSQGISINITSPQFDTALAILKKKIEMHQLPTDEISDDVLEFIANNFKSDIRQLEGALNRIIFYNINNKDTINDTETLSKVLNTLTPSNSVACLSIDNIVETVADYYSLTKAQLLSKVRTNRLALARHIAMYLCRVMLQISFVRIGHEFGNRDHSTVMNAYEKVDSLVKNDPEYKHVINNLKKLLTT